MRKICLVIISVLILPTLLVPASAVSYHGIETTGSYELPDDFLFSVSDTCSGHGDFSQVSACEDGSYAVCALYASLEDWDAVYSKHFVDIYDSDGHFVKEISYYTDLSNAIELTSDSLNIYFHTAIVSYNLKTGNISAYTIPSLATVESGLLSDLRRDTFTSGQWTYTCSGGWMYSTKLVRKSETETQVLLDYADIESPNQFENHAEQGIARIGIILVICMIFRIWKKKQ